MDVWIIDKAIVFLILHYSYHLVAVAEQELSQRICDDATRMCYYLYRDSNRLSHLNAWQECSKYGQKLAVIPDETTQNAFKKFNHNNGEELVRPWLAGWRSNDPHWKGLDGEPFIALNYEESSDFKCSAYTASTIDIYYAVPCKVPSGLPTRRLSVCQMSAQNGFCPVGSSIVVAVDTCYALVVKWTSSAFDGNTVCTMDYPGSTLAYKDVNTGSFRKFVHQTMDSLDGPSQDVWLGIFRKPWVWLPNGRDGGELLVQSSYWRNGFGTNNDCITIDIKNDHTWLDVDCNEEAYYFMCQGEGIYASTTTTTTTTTTPALTVAGAGQSADGGVGGSGLSEMTIIIIACVGAALLLIFIIVIAVVCTRKRKEKKPRPAGMGRHNYNADSYQRSISPMSRSRQNNLNRSDDNVSNATSQATGIDSTNRDITPLDFNILWSNVQEKRKSKNTNPPPNPDRPLYSNDGFLYDT